MISLNFFVLKTKRIEQKNRNERGREKGNYEKKKDKRKNMQSSKVLYFCF